MNDVLFRPLHDASSGAADRSMPLLFRGLAAQWPAVARWSFAHLRRRIDDRPVQLVQGNRERGTTRFVSCSLHDYLSKLELPDRADEEVAYLKEFDLLAAAPELAQELPYAPLLPPGRTGFPRAWIGPAGARTGLHYDYLDNVAVQISGTKRWRLVRAGTVERAGAVSKKYDEWAKLSMMDAASLARHTGSTDGGFFTVDTCPGDVLCIPARWWHEVENTATGIGMGLFHAARVELLHQWLAVAARERLHRWGWLARGNCTCHPASSGKPGDAAQMDA